VFSYPLKFKLDLTNLTGKTGYAENEYTLNDYAPDLKGIPLTFVFYDEMDD
jgi:hypothetical protein